MSHVKFILIEVLFKLFANRNISENFCRILQNKIRLYIYYSKVKIYSKCNNFSKKFLKQYFF